MVPTKCPNMFSGRVEACPCPEFRNRFPNLYLEPMQYDNSDGKWQGHHLLHDHKSWLWQGHLHQQGYCYSAYAHEEDMTCEYLEVNEVIESTEFQNWTPRQRSNITDSDLVFSPAQVTEHHHMELKDQDISPCTRNRFETLKKEYPEVFS